MSTYKTQIIADYAAVKEMGRKYPTSIPQAIKLIDRMSMDKAVSCAILLNLQYGAVSSTQAEYQGGDWRESRSLLIEQIGNKKAQILSSGTSPPPQNEKIREFAREICQDEPYKLHILIEFAKNIGEGEVAYILKSAQSEFLKTLGRA